jgi:hypothetical protein
MNAEVRWVDLGLPCPVCAVNIGPHLHSLREDGSLGILVKSSAGEQP